ncbi:MAG: TolC family protein [Vampirovibrionales bacterium]|nr:TolC family protein [Vampirovibrionales bacterium]
MQCIGRLRVSLAVGLALCAVALTMTPFAQAGSGVSDVETALNARFAHTPWTLAAADATPLTLQQALDQTLENNPDIQAAKEKISEMQAKRAMVKNKRLLFFFRYFNASFLEGSAESDTQAAREHLEAVTQKALLACVTAYYNDVRATLKSYLDYRRIRQGVKSVLLAQRRFESGDGTGLDLIAEKSLLLKRDEDYQQSLSLRPLAQAQLALAMGDFPAKARLRPSDLSFSEGRFQIPQYQQAFPPLETLLAEPIDKRPDSRELFYRRLSIYNLLRANINQFDKNQTRLMQATLAQLDMKLKRARQAAEASVIQAWQTLTFARQSLSIAEERAALARTALRQVQISEKAGFSSEKDALDAQVRDDEAQIALIDAQLDYNHAQFRLLYAVGDLTPDATRALVLRPVRNADPSQAGL